MDFDKLLELLRALAVHEVEYVLVGGVALNVHGLLRGTEDVDLFLLPTATNIAHLKMALQSVWDDPDIEQIRAEDLTGDYPTVRYVPPSGPAIDLLCRLGTEFEFKDLEAQDGELEGAPVRVATPLTLFRMKRNTIRHVDKADAEFLRKKFGLGE